jgi:3-phosphoshikimate 1-carboxyvinyltransferase
MKTIDPVKTIDAVITVPGSKSYTQRALIAAALAPGRSVIRGALISQDTRYLMAALRQLGATVTVEETDVVVQGTGGTPATPTGPIDMGNNGTGLRLLTSVAALCRGTVVIDGAPRMRQRPIQPLLDALSMLGVTATCLNQDGCPPVRIRANGIAGGKALLDAAMSSQFLSSLLMAAPYAAGDVAVGLKGPLPSQPYVAISIDVMKTFGVPVVQHDSLSFFVEAPRAYRSLDYVVEGDLSSATYFMAAAAICGGTVCIENVRGDSLQGDLRFGDILRAFGCDIHMSPRGLTVTGPLSYHEDMAFDLGDAPDMVPALAVVCAFRKGKTRLKRIGHLRIKECDRILALASELKKIGATVAEGSDEMTVQGLAFRGADIDCFDDHRIAMSFAVAGLAIPGVSIKDPDCVGKSFPDFWKRLESLR